MDDRYQPDDWYTGLNGWSDGQAYFVLSLPVSALIAQLWFPTGAVLLDV